MGMARSVFIAALTVSFAPLLHAAECKSKNVWDAGYVLGFDLSSYPGATEPRILARVFEIVPLWRRELVYQGRLAQIGPGYTGLCEFDLIDRAAEPTARIAFKVDT